MGAWLYTQTLAAATLLCARSFHSGCQARNAKSNLTLPFVRDIDAGVVSCPHGGQWTYLEHVMAREWA